MANFILTAFPLRSYSNPSIHYFTNSYVFRYLTSFFSFFFIYLLPSFIYSYLHSSTLPLYLSLFPPPPFLLQLPLNTFHSTPSQLISFHLISQVLTHGLLSRTLSPLVRVTGIVTITSTTARERGVKK